jgi:hypothetical protein
LNSNCHVITTVRRKTDYSLDKDGNGKTKVMKLGTKEITRDGFEYELTVNFELINDNHLVTASKDRTGLFSGKPEFVINSSTGKKLIEWCNLGVSIEIAMSEINACENIEGLKHVYSKYPSLQKQIHNAIINRKNQIENIANHVVDEKEIVKPLIEETHGIST